MGINLGSIQEFQACIIAAGLSDLVMKGIYILGVTITKEIEEFGKKLLGFYAMEKLIPIFLP